jgi:Tfp pilus assembly pilus retraction ATPase PilT
MAGTYNIADLLELTVREGAKALHLESGAPPFLHASGPPRQLDLPALSYGDVAELFSAVATPQQSDELRKCGDSYFVYSSPRSGRFAVSANEEQQKFRLEFKPL